MLLSQSKPLVAWMVAAALLGGSALAVGSLSAKGQEQKPQLLYGDKDFDAWRKFLQIQLKPELQIEAIKALRAFGANGYGEEAAVAIIEVMKKYDAIKHLDEEEKVLVEAAEALARIGNPAVPALAKELKSKKANDRRLVAGVLKKLEDDAAVSLAIQALSDEDFDVGYKALWALHDIVVYGEWPKSISDAEKKSLVAPLKGMLKDKNRSQVQVVQILGSIGSDAKDAVPSLIAAFADKGAYKDVIFGAFASIGPDAKEAVPVIVSAYEKDEVRGDRVFEALDKIGPEARKALVPALVNAFSDQKDFNRKKEAMVLLNKLGPDARDALPVVIKALQKVEQKSQLSADITWYAITFIGSFGPEAKAAIPRLIEIRDATELEEIATMNVVIPLGSNIFTDVKEAAEKALKQIQK
ncbi:MAG TPA: HEAT repeat domain-containing protein [Gemmataceae bacterium]|nr:HEAT repeat domain-containing protein [Gemmataceae bacterium]